MKGIIRYFIKNELAANLLMIALIVFGLFAVKGLKSTFFPEVPSRIISVRAIYPGASPEEVEEGIVKKIEENLKGVTGIEQVTSVSQENAGNITIEVEKGYDTDLVVREVENAVDEIASFPVSMEPIVVYKRENIGFAISFALSGNVDLNTLKEEARKVEDELRAFPEISKVELSGFPEQEIEIAFDENSLQAYALTFAQAANAVRAYNVEITGGTIKGAEEELLVRARNKKYYADELRNIPVKTLPTGDVIRLYQVAEIQDKWVDNPNRTFFNGNPSVTVTVSNTLEEDLLTIAEKVRDYVEVFNERPGVVKASIIRDSSTTLNQRIELLRDNGIIGFLLVLIILAMFLNWRLAFWVALAIPICFCGMFIFAGLLDVTINVITLFGMILVIGILVDDGIVVSESIYQLYEQGMDRTEAAVEGTMRVLPSVFSAILTTVIAFMTFFFLDGRLGDFFQEMAIVVIFSLIFSLVEGVLILPAHVAHSEALRKNKKRNPVTKALDDFMIFLRDKLYGPAFRFSLNHKFLTVALSVGAFLLIVGMFRGGIIKGTFFPVIERDNITIELKLPAGTREHITQKWLDHIEQSAWQANEELAKEYYNDEKVPILIIQKQLGPSSYEGGVNITLLDGENRGELSNRMISSRVRELTGVIQEAEVLTFGQASAFGKPVSISLVGENYKELDQATIAFKEELQKLAELSDVTDNNRIGLKEVNISLKPRAYTLGLDLATILAQVRSGFFGSEVQRLQRGEDEVRVWVRYSEEDRSNINKLKQMRIRFADGREYPLEELATLEIERGVIAINHLDGMREVKVEADIGSDDVSVSDIMANIQGEIAPRVLSSYPSVKAVFEGQSKQQRKTSESVQRILPVILFIMFITVALTFQSLSQTFVVFLLIPFAFIGVALGHYIEGKPISLFSMLGVIALVGVLVNDALVLVSTYNQNLKTGMQQMEAIYETGISRFRPIVLTTITTVAGLFPLLSEKSLQAQFLIPMAISVAYGLMVVTVLTLFLLPVLLVLTNRFKYYAAWLWNGTPTTYEAVEAATDEKGGYNFLYWLVPLLLVLYYSAKNMF